jgi:hypothetical protein
MRQLHEGKTDEGWFIVKSKNPEGEEAQESYVFGIV